MEGFEMIGPRMRDGGLLLIGSVGDGEGMDRCDSLALTAKDSSTTIVRSRNLWLSYYGSRQC